MGADVATIVLEAEPSQVAPARRFVRRILADSTDPSTLSDLQLIVSELFTNAVEHGVDGTVRVVVHDSPDFVGVTVQSRGPAPEVGEATHWHVAEPSAISGRGLGIVRELADEVVVERKGDDLLVTARCATRDRAGCTTD
jgi:anti-sigma regulatory factor (Ser/Thr protein kinase)